MANHFECSLCYETKTQARPPRVIDGSPVCEDCVVEYIVPLFEAALDSEESYPVRWGPIELASTAFQDILGQTFVRRFRQRQAEYDTKPFDRIYCTHRVYATAALPKGVDAPEKLALTAEQLVDAEDNEQELVHCGAMCGNLSTAAGRKLLCYHCRGRVCGACEQPLASITSPHACAGRPRTNRLAEDAETDGLTRGEHFQLCPGASCGRAVIRDGGCNHMTCPKCITHFCWLCGVEAAPHMRHWSPGSLGVCPLYGTREAPGRGAIEHQEPQQPLPEPEPLEAPQPARPQQQDSVAELAAFDTRLNDVLVEIRANSHFLLAMPFSLVGRDLEDLARQLHRNIEEPRFPLADDTDQATLLTLFETFQSRDEQIQHALPRVSRQGVRQHMPSLLRLLEFYDGTRRPFIMRLVRSLAGQGEL